MTDRSTARLGVLAVTLFALPLLVGCQPAERGQMAGTALDTAAVKAAVDSLRDAYLEAYNSGEAGQVAALYTQDAVYLPADGPPVTGRDSIQAALTQALAPGPTLEVDSHEVIPLSPDWTSSGGTYRVTVTPEGAEEPRVIEGSYLILFRQTAEGWKLFRHAATLDSLPPTPGGQ